MIERQAVRALLLSPQAELLLIKIIEPKSKRTFWLTPGGGIDPGESPTAGLRREVFEETGLLNFEIGPEVWQREHKFTWDGQVILQHERYYVVRVHRFEPTVDYLPDQMEQATFGGFGWWTAQAISQSAEDFAPHGLGVLLRSLIQEGLPSRPIVLRD